VLANNSSLLETRLAAENGKPAPMTSLDCDVTLDVAHEDGRHAPDRGICAVSIVKGSSSTRMTLGVVNTLASILGNLSPIT
jgi:hypothetical protein